MSKMLLRFLILDGTDYNHKSALSDLLCANTKVGRCTFSITFATVKVLPDPVTPNRV